MIKSVSKVGFTDFLEDVHQAGHQFPENQRLLLVRVQAYDNAQRLHGLHAHLHSTTTVCTMRQIIRGYTRSGTSSSTNTSSIAEQLQNPYSALAAHLRTVWIVHR